MSVFLRCLLPNVSCFSDLSNQYSASDASLLLRTDSVPSTYNSSKLLSRSATNARSEISIASSTDSTILIAASFGIAGGVWVDLGVVVGGALVEM